MMGGLFQLFFLMVFLIPYIFFLLTLYRTAEQISIENRRLAAAQVWLLLIPLFNLIWMFVVINKLATSIKQECDRLNISYSQPTPTKDIGNIYALLAIASVMPVIGFFFGLGAFVCWIIYWTQVAGFRKKFIENKDNELLDVEKLSA
jgi:hypothetical protein